MGDYKLIDGYPGKFNSWYPPESEESSWLDDQDYLTLYDEELSKSTASVLPSNWTSFEGLFNIKGKIF